MHDEAAQDALIEAIRSILRPLVRQCIAHGLTFPAFARIGKEVFIDVGTRYFALPFKRQTDSRVALVTGITRKEIGQIRRGQAPGRATAEQLDYGLATRVISHWVTEERYRGDGDDVAALPYEATPPAASFVGLVDEIGGDIPPRAVLDELIRVGVAELTPDGLVRLAQRAYIPSRSPVEKLAILGADAAQLIDAITHNIDHPAEEAFLQRKVAYDNIGADALAELRARVKQAGGEFLQAMNVLFATYDRDRNPRAPGGERKQAILGLYYLDESHTAPASPPARRQKPRPKRR
jgi:hypothetical protein